MSRWPSTPEFTPRTDNRCIAPPRLRARAVRAGSPRLGWLGLCAAVCACVCFGCAELRAVGGMSAFPLGSTTPSYQEVSRQRPARFALDENLLVAVVDALPRSEWERPLPFDSFQASAQIVVVTTISKPTSGTLWMLAGTAASRFDVRSLTLLPEDTGEQRLQILARNSWREIDLIVVGEPVEDFGALRRSADELCRSHHIPSVRPPESKWGG